MIRLREGLLSIFDVMRKIRLGIIIIQSFIGRIYFYLWGVQAGKKLRMGSLPYCRVVGSGKIVIGDHVRINNKLSENPAGITHKTVLVAGKGAVLKIGNNVGISGSIIYALESVTIGDGCRLGANSMIYTTDFHPLNADDRRDLISAATVTKPVVLKKNVWLGANTVVLRGVTIGEGSVVAIGSIVTKDVPDGVIVAGNPAKVIKPVPTERYSAQ